MFQQTLKELLPSWENVVRYEEVIAFTCCQMKNPEPLVQHVYDLAQTEDEFFEGFYEETGDEDVKDEDDIDRRSGPPSINQLILRDYIISDEKAFKAMIMQPRNRLLSVIDFGGTNLGFNARHIKNILSTCHLNEICLNDCQIPPPVCRHLFHAMSKCRKITHLNMAWNKINSYGHDLAETILAWDENPALKELDLSHCSIPPDASRHLMSALGRCKRLTNLWLPGNTLTGCLPSFISGEHAGLPFLEELLLNYTGLNNRDILHLTHLMKEGKLSGLKELDLGANYLHRMEGILEGLVEACVNSHQRELKLYLWFNNLSIEFVDKCKLLCSNRNLKLCFEPEDDAIDIDTSTDSECASGKFT